MSGVLAVLTLLLTFFYFVPPTLAVGCEDLAKLSLPNTTVTLAQNVAAGAFTPPAGRGGTATGGNPFSNLSAFCRVQATLKPSNDSDIKMELWMPTAANWNGKFRGTGNGGLGGGPAVN